MKGCELCPNNNNSTAAAARVYCESDEASLCFECDAKVHSANFLVARHSRVLLCRRCQSPTPWRAEGRRLGPTVSLCHRCSSRSKKIDDEADVDDENDDDDQESEDEEECEEEGEEQVVPGTMETSPAAAPPTPPASSSSSSGEEEMMGRNGGLLLLKRRREDVFLDLPSYYPCSTSQDQLPCSFPSRPSYMPNRTAVCSSIGTVVDGKATSDSFRPMKDRKRLNLIRSGSHQLSLDMMSFSTVRPPI